MADDKQSGGGGLISLKALAVVGLLLIIGFQVYSGISLKKVGVPGIFELEFQEHGKNSSEQSEVDEVKNGYKADDLDVVERERTPREPLPQTATINLAYAGDFYGCNLPISIQIGGSTFLPQGNLFQASGVSLGSQNYTINGQIHCPGVGSCEARGAGQLMVQAGRTYNIIWQNSSFGICDVVLQ